MQISNGNSGLAIDPSLSTIKNDIQKNESNVQAAAEQFEAIFLQLVLQRMHAGTEAISGDNGLFSSNSLKTYRDMHDAQLAQHLSSQHQLGFAEAITKQIGSDLEGAEKKFNEFVKSAALHNGEGEVPRVTNKLASNEKSSSLVELPNGAFNQPIRVI